MTLAKGRRSVGRPPDTERQQRRHAEILDAATDVFARHGFAATDVQEIADRIGVGKGTVYRYFPSKEELFLAAVDHGMRQLRESVDAAADLAKEPLERISVAIRAYLGFFDTHPEVVELLIQERAHFRDRKKPTYFVHRDANIGRWHAFIAQLIQDGVMRDLPVEQIADFVSDVLYGTMFTNYFSGRKTNLTSQCEQIVDLIYHGLLVQPRQPPPHQ